MHRPVFDPKDAGKGLLSAPWLSSKNGNEQGVLLEKGPKYRVRK